VTESWFDPRASWRAVAPTKPLKGWPHDPAEVVVHYVGGPGQLTPALVAHDACLQLVHALQHAAISGQRPWPYSDLEYNLVACHHARVIEGRGLDYAGAAQLNANDQPSVLALLNVGDQLDAGTMLGLDRARQLVAARWPACTGLTGHRDTAGNPTGTNCPGDQLDAWCHAGGPLPKDDPVEHGMAVDLVLNPADPTMGYVLDRWGGVHSIGHAPAVTVSGSWPGQDVARRLVVTDWSPAHVRGHVMDLDGATHPISGTPALVGGPYWAGGIIVPIQEL
jgi:hypothetical protein